MSIRPRTVAFGLLTLAVSASLYWFGFGSRQASPTAAPRPWSLGRVTDGHQGIAGVRVYADRQPRVAPAGPQPLAITDSEGRFRLELAPGDAVLAVEKDGWQRDLVPAAEWSREIVLRPEPGFRKGSVLLVRLDFPDEPSRVPDHSRRVHPD